MSGKPIEDRVIGHCEVCGAALTPEDGVFCDVCPAGPWCIDCVPDEHDCSIIDYDDVDELCDSIPDGRGTDS